MAETRRDDSALQEAFDALFCSTEETVESLLRSFTALSTVDCALLMLNDVGDASENPLSGINAERFSAAMKELDYRNSLPTSLGHHHGSSNPVEEIEVVEVDEGASIHTGAMAVLARHEALDIVPSFDNFVDYEAPMNSNGEAPRAELHADLISAVLAPSGNGEKDEEEVLDLPGTQVTGESQRVVLTAADIAELREDPDEIQNFALDRNIDYDADIVGCTARLNPRERP